MSDVTERTQAPKLRSAIAAAITSQAGRAVLQCLAACTLQALQNRGTACGCTRPK